MRCKQNGIQGWLAGGILVFWLMSGLSLGAQVMPHVVLVLASYQPGSRLEEEQIAGLRATLPADVELVIEYLDAKRMARRKSYLPLYVDLMYGKYKTRRLDAIVALNDDAIRFTEYFRTNIFLNIPLVLCGSNRRVVEAGPNLSGWTGVFSTPDIEKTIQLALALHPKAKAVHVIVDRTTPGQTAEEQIRAAAAAGRFSAPVVLPDPDRPWPFKRMVDHLRHVRPANVVFFAEFYQDYAGLILLPHRLVPYLSAESRAPIYTMQNEAIGTGAVGGNVINGRAMGRVAGELTVRILEGEEPGRIPPVVLEGEWLFDDAQLHRWGIKDGALPPGSRIIGRQVSFYAQNKVILLVGGLIALVELAIIALLLLNRAGRIRAQKSLQISESRYRSLFETSEDLFLIIDRHGRLLHANPAACRLLGYAQSDLAGRAHTDLIVPAERQRVRKQLDLVANGARTVLESYALTHEGEELPVEFVFQPFDFDGGPAVVCIGHNLSEQFKIQRLSQEISERERQAMGHDIHDGLGQYLTALRFQCHRLEQMAAEHRNIGPGDLSKLTQIATELAEEIRSLGRALVPLQMVARSLATALQELMELNMRQFQVKATLDYTLDERQLLPDVAAHLYRIVQEAVRNAVRHAEATTVRVVLRTISVSQAELIVENDGQPFQPVPERRVGMGLSIMEQRARLIGGTLQIQPAEAHWTRLICRFPLGPEAQDRA